MSERPLIWDYSPGVLRDPVVVCAFGGSWSGHNAAALPAVDFLISSLGAERFARIDSESFFDFQACRPRVKVVKGIVQEITWPGTEIYVARMPEEASRDLVLIRGLEPSFRWPTFANVIKELVDVLGSGLFVSFGSFLAEVLHTKPPLLVGAVSDQQLLERMSIQLPSFNQRIGIVAVLHAACSDDGIAAATIWAQTPRYTSGFRNPKAMIALIRELEALAGITVDTAELTAEVTEFEELVAQVVRTNDEIGRIVKRLELEDEVHARGDGEASSGDQIARDFQRFFKQQDQQDESE